MTAVLQCALAPLAVFSGTYLALGLRVPFVARLLPFRIELRRPQP